MDSFNGKNLISKASRLFGQIYGKLNIQCKYIVIVIVILIQNIPLNIPLECHCDPF